MTLSISFPDATLAYGNSYGASTGVYLGAGATFTNSGTINGAAGGYNTFGTGGTGGDGVDLAAGDIFTNDGQITGGTGGGTFYGSNGAGGVGVYLAAGAVLDNQGSISGGAGAAAFRFTYSDSKAAGSEGAGVYLNGGTLINAGTISGSDAVIFAAAAGTLELEPGAKFIGDVLAHANDVLKLGGTTWASFHGLGTQITGFGSMEVLAGAEWDLDGTNRLGAGTLDLAGKLVVGGTLQASSVALSGGVLKLGHGSIVIGGSAAGADAGALLVRGDGAIAGFGALKANEIINNGRITASGGVLALDGPVSGNGTLLIDAGATALVNGSLDLGKIHFAASGGELALAQPALVESTIMGFGAKDLIDLRSFKVTAASFADNTLDLYKGAALVDQLVFQGSYSNNNFSITSDQHGGTLIAFVHN